MELSYLYHVSISLIATNAQQPQAGQVTSAAWALKEFTRAQHLGAIFMRDELIILS